MIDAHHHIWRQTDLPWLLGPEQPRIFGSYAGIKRDYPIDEYLVDIADCGIKRSVYVQANWAPNWFADEAAWVQSIADKTGWPDAIVAYADFTVDDVRPQLDKLAQYPRVRGIRQQLHWHENPAYRFAATDSVGSSPVFQKNLAYLEQYDWCFDLQLFTTQVEHAIALATACPNVNMILQHAGMPEDTTDTGWHHWHNAMAAMAQHDNIYVKLSGLGTFVHCVDEAMIQRVVTDTVSLFGAERCMYGSNFPIEKLWASYSDVFTALKRATSALSDTDVAAIFNDTAERVYRL